MGNSQPAVYYDDGDACRVCTASYHSVTSPAPPTWKYRSKHVKHHHAHACRPNRCPAPLSRHRHLDRELRRHAIRRARPSARARVGAHQRRRQEPRATKGKLPRHVTWQLEAGIRSASRQVLALCRWWSATLGIPGPREFSHRCSNGQPQGRSTFPRRSTRCRWCSMTVLVSEGSPSATASKHVPGQGAGCSRTCYFAVHLSASNSRRHSHKLGVGAHLVAAGGPSAPVRLLARHQVAPDG